MYDFTAVRVPLQLFTNIDDVFTGAKTYKKLVERLSPVEHYMIEDPLVTHQDANWGWDARCYFFDRIVDAFDRLELQRAGLDENNTNTASSDSSEIDKERAQYRRVTVPEFINTLSLRRTCPDD